ncbi:2-C-methyl-D-erythritol 4-phosphate cytidylyltransferase [Frisingicoccus sp.]|uniref:IspD/TarI family cytidylyltransferase n=1 Tax=Frisingicoccus sp. TaxID=1918627 RepID=UPI003AB64E32
MIFGVIVAGGVGSRMGADMPKQFLKLADRPIIMHTLGAFLKCSEPEHIYMGIHPEWVEYMAELVREYVPEGEQHRVHLIPGGAERNETIMNVIQQIEKDFGNEETHYIITQDGVRPFVTQRLIKEHVSAVVQYDAVDTAIPAVDTIIFSEDGIFIDNIPERKYLYQSQTPQSFRMDLLKQLYLGLTPGEKSILTDACKICTVRQVPVHIVAGEVSNMKITTAADYKIAQIMAENGELNTENL